ncbi:MAG: alpha/beta hydrolase [Myxococcales bacterium]|nr:alpha/beta hydrolase [Myxococcales bacterium]
MEQRAIVHDRPGGVRLHVQQWFVADAPQVLLLPGRGEPAAKYDELASEWVQRGFSVSALDWRGQGASGRESALPNRGHIRSFDDYAEDLVQICQELHVRDAVVVAHSMGGHMALRLAHDHADMVRGLILSAPMVALNLPGPRWAIGRTLQLALRLGLGERHVPVGRVNTGFDDNDLTGDRGRYDRYAQLLADRPELTTGQATLAWLSAALHSIDLIWRPGYAERIAAPCLMCVPADDSVVPPDGVRAFASRLPRARCVVFPRAKHELFAEQDGIRAALWQQMDAFLATLPASTAR